MNIEEYCSLDEKFLELRTRIFDVRASIYFLNEFIEQRNSSLYADYSLYLEAVFSRFHNYIINEIYCIFDMGEDAISIEKLKNEVISLHNDKNIKKTIKNEYKSAYTKEIDEYVNVIRDFRNHCGVAHGNKRDYTRKISFKSVNLISIAIEKMYNILLKYYNGSYFNFDVKFEHKSLIDLAKDYENIKR